MKKTILLGLSILGMMLGAQAQTTTVQTGPENKDFPTKFISSTQIIGEDASSLLMVTRHSGHFFQNIGNPDLSFLKTDKGLTTIKETLIEDSKDLELFGTGTTDTTAAVLMCDRSKKYAVLSRMVVDRNTLDIKVRETVDTLKHDRKDDTYLRHITSANGQWTAVIAMIFKSEGYTCEVLMFDNQMNKRWTCSYPLIGITDLFLSNEGSLYVMAMNRKGMSTEIYIDKLDAVKSVQAKIQIADGLNTATIANVIDNRVLIGGTLRYGEARRNSMQTNGVFALSYDIVAKQIVKFDLAALHHDDLAVLLDKKQSAKIRKAYVEELIVDQTCPTNFGGVFSFTLPYAVQKTASNGETEVFYSRTGLVVMGMDKDGNMLFKVPVRHFQTQTNDSYYLTTPMFSDGTNTYLVHTEDPGTVPEYNIAKRTKCIHVGTDKANTALYVISSSGNVQKQVITTKQKSLVLGCASDWFNNSYILLHTTGKHSNIFQLKTEK